MGDVIQFEAPVVLQQEVCPDCGIKFAIPQQYISSRREDHKGFRCPNGHNIHYPAKSTTDTLRDLETQITSYRKVFERISKLKVRTFNRSTLELAIELATNALK